MVYIRRSDGMNVAAAGRSLRGLVVRLDDSELVAEVDNALTGDQVIDAVTYASTAQAIRDWNTANTPAPLTDAELQAIAAILDKADTNVTAGELKTVALGALRRLRARGALG